jgi:hypothetical protein
MMDVGSVGVRGIIRRTALTLSHEEDLDRVLLATECRPLLADLLVDLLADAAGVGLGELARLALCGRLVARGREDSGEGVVVVDARHVLDGGVVGGWREGRTKGGKG